MCLRATVGYRRVKFIQFVNTIRQYRRKAHIARVFKVFRFDPQVYADFKALASKNGCAMTSALEKFMADSLKFGLIFPSAKQEAAEAEARVMLSWLKEGKYLVNLGGKEGTSKRGTYYNCCPRFKKQLEKGVTILLKRSIWRCVMLN